MREYELLKSLASGLSEPERQELAAMLNAAAADERPERWRDRSTAVTPRRPRRTCEERVPVYRRSSLESSEIDALLD